MQSEKISVQNNDNSIEAALSVADDFINELKTGQKYSMRLRLLVEETLGMVRAMVGDFSADFWMESNEKVTKVRLDVVTYMNSEKKSDLLSMSTSGVNVSAKGFMGMISDIIENGLLNYDSVMSMHNSVNQANINYSSMGMGMISDVVDNAYMWSLQNYRDNLNNVSEDVDGKSEAWDQLERSIVAKIADDVIVGVKSDNATLTVIYNF